MGREIVISRGRGGAVAVRSHLPVPGIVADAGDAAARRFLEFFAATIRNRNTRAAYYRAVELFFAWCDRRRIRDLAAIEPLHVAAGDHELAVSCADPVKRNSAPELTGIRLWKVPPASVHYCKRIVISSIL